AVADRAGRAELRLPVRLREVGVPGGSARDVDRPAHVLTIHPPSRLLRASPLPGQPSSVPPRSYPRGTGAARPCPRQIPPLFSRAGQGMPRCAVETWSMESFLTHAGYLALILFAFVEACSIPISSEITFGFA